MGKNGIFEDGQKRQTDRQSKTGKIRRDKSLYFAPYRNMALNGWETALVCVQIVGL